MLGRGSPTKIDNRNKGTLFLTSLLEDPGKDTVLWRIISGQENEKACSSLAGSAHDRFKPGIKMRLQWLSLRLCVGSCQGFGVCSWFRVTVGASFRLVCFHAPQNICFFSPGFKWNLSPVDTSSFFPFCFLSPADLFAGGFSACRLGPSFGAAPKQGYDVAKLMLKKATEPLGSARLRAVPSGGRDSGLRLEREACGCGSKTGYPKWSPGK